MQLTKVEKNEVFEAIVRGGLNPRDCSLNESSQFYLIIHMSSRSLFDMSASRRGGYAGKRRLGDDPYVSYSVGSWIELLKHIQKWAYDVKDYVNIPDYWAEAGRARSASRRSATASLRAASASSRASLASRTVRPRSTGLPRQPRRRGRLPCSRSLRR